ncbi:MAG: aldo/keto reductase [Clostridia bacterium]|nr:aldo/keto reductase [Clostridia bacterium]
MKNILLTGTDLMVSPLSLGTVNYGSKTGEKESFCQMDAYLDAGGNFIDTASVYGCFPPSTEQHASEKVVGRWMKERNARSKVVISTKGGHPFANDPSFTIRLHRDELFSDVEKSLLNLQTDVIDMYFLHRDDLSLPVGEVMETLEEIKKQGKIKNYGFSNWTLPRAMEAQAYCKKHGLSGFTMNQLMWSLAHINHDEISDKTLVAMDKDTYKWHADTNLSAMAYRAVAKGYFEKRKNGAPMRGDLVTTYKTDINDRIFDALLALHKETSLSMTTLSLQYFLSQPFPSVAIASFTNDTQLKEGLSVLTEEINPEILARIHALRQDLQ